jgi:hypothetical protein
MGTVIENQLNYFNNDLLRSLTLDYYLYAKGRFLMTPREQLQTMMLFSSSETGFNF